MKNYDKLSDNEHKIDLISLNNFLLEKNDTHLNNLIDKSNFIKKESITKEFFQNNYSQIFSKSKTLNDLGFKGNDFPVDYYTNEIINTIDSYIYHDIKYLLYLNSNIKEYFSICKEAIKRNGLALKYIPKTTENYYELVKIVFEKSIELTIVNYAVKSDWFPKEYIPQLIIDFPSEAVFLKQFINENLLKHYIKKLIKENLFKRKNNF
jgi:hypothetical protein